MYKNKLNELELQGFGLSHSGIHLKHLKNENKNLVIFNIYPSIYIKHKMSYIGLLNESIQMFQQRMISL